MHQQPNTPEALDLDGTLADAVAVIGLSCRFPDAPTAEAYWDNLRAGVESVRSFTAADLRAAGVDPAIMDHESYVNAGVVLDGAATFDAAFFGLSPRDAEILDPQQRIFLECAWSALEDAAYDPASYEGPIGVYAGADMSSYLFNLYSNPEIVASVGAFAISLGNDKDHVTTRVAYKLDLKGPAVTVQTTCSTSLVAVCQAAQSLLYYQCDLALAGGTAVAFPQGVGYVFQEGGIASPDGHCRAFDASARGTIGGSGAGAVVLKRYADAIADGDAIRAVIRGFGLNNDGSLKVGYTAPSVEGQAEAIATAQAMAQVHPETVSYIEAHGTGTPLGDPIEVTALTQVFRAATDKVGYCGIGSVKTNFGHLNSAAGVAGLIKTVLALEHRELPPSLHFERPNPNLGLEGSPFFVVDRLRPWEADGTPRRAGISSFGIGGTNAHVVVEEAPAPAPRDAEAATDGLSRLMVVSARTQPALDEAVGNLARHLSRHPELSLDDVAYTLQVGRRAFSHRRMTLVAGDDVEAAVAALERGTGPDVVSGTTAGDDPPRAFLFSGQGAQHAGMGCELYAWAPVFAAEFDRCAAALAPRLGLDLGAVVFGRAPDAADRLRQTALAQPALFALEYALARQWAAWGVEPSAMAGHSIGEFVAACLAGVFSLEDALAVVAARGRLMQAMPPGSMLAVPQSEQEIGPLLELGLSLAAVNAPGFCVVSGTNEAVGRAEEQLAAAGVGATRLRTSHAFHSHLFDPVVEPFIEEVSRIERHAPRVPYVSNVTGTWIGAQEATDPAYWGRHLRQTVQFARCVQALAAEPDAVLLEVGPGTTLRSLAQQQLGRSERVVLSSLPHPQDGTSESRAVLGALGRLWVAGAAVDWRAFNGARRGRRVSLPTYPFQRERYWVEPRRPVEGAAADGAARADVGAWFSVPGWELARPSTLAARTGEVLLLAPERADAPGLEDELSLSGAAVVPRPRERYGRAEFARRLREPREQGRPPATIVYAWELGAGRGRDRTIEELPAGVFELLALAQAIDDELPGVPVQLRVVTDRACVVAAGEGIRPERAMLAGACRVIAQELPGVRTQVLDVVLPASASLQAELAAEPDAPLLALRGDQRYVPRVEARPLAPAQIGRRLRRNGAYLITGGLGGIGLAIASYLAQAVQARLILVGRTPLSAAAAADDPRVEAKLQAVQALEAMGAEVLVVSADVADAAGMREVAAQVSARFGTLHGIVHAAGVPGGGIIQLKTPDEAWRVMAPKVAGAEVLADVFGDRRLDFVVLCSSLAAQLGGFGQLDYCAANCFLDAFAHENAFSRRGVPVTSVNWDTWSEVGMAVDTELPDDLRHARAEGLRRGIRSIEGIDAFQRILAERLSQVLVSTTDLGARVQAATDARAAAPAPAVDLGGRAAAHGRPELATPYVEPRAGSEALVAAIWEELLGVAPVGAEDNFLDLGGHSLLAVQLISRIRDAVHQEVSVQTFFERPTVAALARVIDGAEERDKDADTPTRGAELAPLPRDRYRARVGADGAVELPEALTDGRGREGS